jgi:hypothetical protein
MKMKKLATAFALAFLLATGFVACDRKAPDDTHSQEQKKRYSCGMEGHPVTNAPGNCNKCNMELKEIESHDGHDHD